MVTLFAHPGGPLLAGIDLGTTSIKAGLYDRAGRSLAQASAPTPTDYPQPGWAAHDAEAIWQCAAGVLRRVVDQVAAQGRDPAAIAGVAVASMGEAGVLLDAHGAPLAEVIAWFDRRTQPQADWLEHTIGRDRLLAITGLPLQPIFGLCKLLWLKACQPDAFARAARWLNLGDYVAYRLCGAQATDLSLASRTLALDLARREWSREILDAAVVPAALLAPPVASGTRLGAVTPAASAATGLPATCQVAAGGHDHDCGALAVGVTEPGDVLDSLGTAEAIFVPLERPLADLTLGRQGYAQGVHVAPARYYVHGGIYTCGASVEWAHRVVGQGSELATLIAEAAAVPAGSLGVYFLPYLRLANPPYDDPLARGAFAGLTADASRGALFRAVLEGLAYESRLSLDTLLAAPGAAPLRRLVAIGGGTRNALLMRVKAGVLGRPLTVVEVPEAVSLGAALLGGLGAGLYRDLTEIAATVKLPETTIRPDPAALAVYADRFEIYRQLYPALRTFHHAIARVERHQG